MQFCEKCKRIRQFRASDGLMQAVIHSYLDEPDAAFECLNQACDEGDGAVIFLRHDPHFVELRDDYPFHKNSGQNRALVD